MKKRPRARRPLHNRRNKRKPSWRNRTKWRKEGIWTREEMLHMCGLSTPLARSCSNQRPIWAPAGYPDQASFPERGGREQCLKKEASTWELPKSLVLGVDVTPIYNYMFLTKGDWWGEKSVGGDDKERARWGRHWSDKGEVCYRGRIIWPCVRKERGFFLGRSC